MKSDREKMQAIAERIDQAYMRAVTMGSLEGKENNAAMERAAEMLSDAHVLLEDAIVEDQATSYKGAK